MDLETAGDWAALGAFAVTLFGVAFGVAAYLHEKSAFAAKRRRLEAYLKRRAAEAAPGRQGAHSLLHIVSEVRVTEDEAINIAFASPRIEILRKSDEDDSLTRALLLVWRG